MRYKDYVPYVADGAPAPHQNGPTCAPAQTRPEAWPAQRAASGQPPQKAHKAHLNSVSATLSLTSRMVGAACLWAAHSAQTPKRPDAIAGPHGRLPAPHKAG